MPVMTRMRENMPVILFGILIAFIITIIFEWGMDYLGMGIRRSDVIGKVNGQTISQREFTDLLKRFNDSHKAQTGSEPDETQLAQLREQTWQALVTEHLINQEMQRLGIRVTDDEILSWVRSDNPPEELRQGFIDSAGVFRRDIYEQFLQDPLRFIQDPSGLDPRFGAKYLADIEEALRKRRAQEKLQSVLLASVRVSTGEIAGRFREQNVQYDAMYALFDAGTLVKDEDVQLTDADLRSYYEEHLEQYKVEATRKLKYVQFLETPTAEDTALVRRDIEQVAEQARAGTNFIELTSYYQDRPDSGAFFRHGEMLSELEGPVFSAKVGDVVGPILTNDGYHLFKILDQRRSENEFVHASHILFSLAGDDSNEVKQTAQRVLREARDGKDFATLAREHSTDRGSAQRGGDLGWFTKGRMVAPFEQAAFRARPGEVVGPVRSQFGLHIIKVHAKDQRELKIARIVMPITASLNTKNKVQDDVNDFVYTARRSDLEREARALGFEVRESEVREQGGVVPGIGVNEGIVRWAFRNSVGSVSEPFRIPTGYVVMIIAEARNASVRPFDEVKESIRPMALRKKKTERVKHLAAELKARLAPGDSLTRLKELNDQIIVQRTGTFSLRGSVPGLGRDQNFFGVVEALEPGQISPPVEVFRGAMLVHLLSKTPLDSAAFAAQREVLQTQLIQEKRNRVISEWLAMLKTSADIEDNRDSFFR